MNDGASARVQLAVFLRLHPFVYLSLFLLPWVVRFIVHPTLGAVVGCAVTGSLIAWMIFGNTRFRRERDATIARRS